MEKPTYYVPGCTCNSCAPHHWVPPTDEERRLFRNMARRQRGYVDTEGCPCLSGDYEECSMLDALGGNFNYEQRACIAESLAMDGL